jgi:hypothetical protein
MTATGRLQPWMLYSYGTYLPEWFTVVIGMLILCRLQEETARVEQYLLSSFANFTPAIISAYTSAELSQSTFENMLEPLQKLVRLSPPIAASLAAPEIFQRTEQKLGHKDAVTRLNLLRILRTICTMVLF